MIKALWDRQADAIIDAKIGNTDADSFRYQPMAALLDLWEKIKQDKHGKHFHDKWRFFFFCYFSRCHAMEGRTDLTLKYDSTQGSKNVQTHFVRTGMGKRSNRNNSREIVLTHNPQSLTTQ